jgi:hypothetical protein
MKRFALATCAIGALAALLVLAGSGRSGEDKELRAVIDKALEAHGGEAKLAMFKAQILKGNGKFYGLGEAIDYTIEIASQHEKQFRFAMEMTVMNFDLKIVAVVSGDKGWEKINDEVKEMPADELAEHNEHMHCEGVVSLLPLKDKSYKLSSLGDVKVGDQPAVGVRVTKEGRRDVTLYFDKAKGHLIKSEFMVKDIKTSGDKEIMQANLYSDYKEFQGTRHPTRLITERDGKKFTDTQLTELQLVEKLDSSTFDRP